jgi:hypothetical protein
MPRSVFQPEPAAGADDPNWDRAPNHGTVLVRADSPADTRIVASVGGACVVVIGLALVAIG